MRPKTIFCHGCKRRRPANPRVKNQKYCGDAKCRLKRRNESHKTKKAQDEDYRKNYLASLAKWRAAHPTYMQEYRAGHPEYVEANREKQKLRDRWRRKCADVLVKMYSLSVQPPGNIGKTGRDPGCPVLVKMYSLSEKAQQEGTVTPPVPG